MIKMKYADLNNVDLVNSFKTIKESVLPVKAAYRFNRISDLLDKKISEFQVEYKKYFNEHVKKDENGKFIPVKDENGKFLGFEFTDKEKANEVLNELLSEEFTIDVRKVDAEDLQNLSISPSTLFHLEPFIEGLDA